MIKNIPSAILPFKRSAWKPIVKKTNGSITDSKFSGTPYIKEEEGHPRCLNCGKPLQLFVQLNLDQLPEAVRREDGSGMLQLFYCISEEPICEIECEAFFPFSKSVLVRMGESERNVSNVGGIAENSFPAKLIVEWEEVEDHHSWEEAESLGIEVISRPTHEEFGFNGIRFCLHIFNTQQVDFASEVLRPEPAATYITNRRPAIVY